MSDWNAQDYEKNSSAQQKWAQELIAKLNLKGHEHILDLGCGDGKVTAELARCVPGGLVLGVDQSEAMINLAQARYPKAQSANLSFQQMDARQLTFQNEFDVAFSNATLHWVDHHVSVLNGLAAGLRSQGRILLQMGGQGNALGIIQAFETVMRQSQWHKYFEDFTFPYFFNSPVDYQNWLPTTGFAPLRVELIPKDMTHSNSEALAGWIRTTWFPYIQCVPKERAEVFVTEVVEQYLQEHPIRTGGLTHVAMMRLEVEAQKTKAS
ncbi:Trans-aconitate 2-methyltransferase [Acaryochloris thomasi RCC1774]|uniref:Trans-aconitate 2-methyltransferase n=1 Tax=Acaryochloris thomasi RCC1774 TaxID=1764569 RepID=A0A2W1JTF6_9CYAN|nr:methyltransferase domain-containing protein [Acaryochloris thomasi]PZD71927.1 Trans-aconitate 2-methyltransferase [Acaryochloris thomasi RCC1774]